MRKKISKVLLGILCGTFLCSSVVLANTGNFSFNFTTSTSRTSAAVAKTGTTKYFWGSVSSSNLNSSRKISFTTIVNGGINSNSATATGNEQFQAGYKTFYNTSSHSLRASPSVVGATASGRWTP